MPQSGNDASPGVVKIVVLVSIFVALLLLGALGWFWWRRKGRNKRQHGDLSQEASRNADKQLDGKPMEKEAEERPVELAATGIKTAPEPPVAELA